MADFVKNNRNNKKTNNRNKTKDYGSKKESKIEVPEMCGRTFEYQMGHTLAEEILKGSKTSNPQKVLCEYVNTQLGLLGYCVKVFVTAN